MTDKTEFELFDLDYKKIHSHAEKLKPQKSKLIEYLKHVEDEIHFKRGIFYAECRDKNLKEEEIIEDPFLKKLELAERIAKAWLNRYDKEQAKSRIDKINWHGTQAQIVKLIENLIALKILKKEEIEHRKYKFIEENFFDAKNNKEFNHRHLSMVLRAKIDEDGKIIESKNIKKMNELTNNL